MLETHIRGSEADDDKHVISGLEVDSEEEGEKVRLSRELSTTNPLCDPRSIAVSNNPVLSSDENYWPSTYSNSSGASPNGAGIGGSGYYSPNHHQAATAAMKRSRSPNMLYHNLQLHHNGNHSNHIEHTGYYVPQYEKLGECFE